MRRLLSLDPGTYQRHLIHGEGRTWAETNCYVDVWIETMHAFGYEPIAALPFTFAIDFEGDQWTFFKFPLLDLYDLFGIDVQELAIWRPLETHIEEQVGRGRPVMVELDSFYLPDTHGTAYKMAHVKSTVAIIEIDTVHRHMGYFHNQGYYHVDGEDYLDLLRLRGTPDPAMLPPYVEFVKFHPGLNCKGRDLVDRSLGVLQKQLRLIPVTNPFPAFKSRIQTDLQWLMTEPIDTFHLYSFATLRQFGACYELSTTYLNWLKQQGETGLEDIILSFTGLSDSAKAMQFQLARAMARRKPLDLSTIDLMAETWQRGTSALKTRFSG